MGRRAERCVPPCSALQLLLSPPPLDSATQQKGAHSFLYQTGRSRLPTYPIHLMRVHCERAPKALAVALRPFLRTVSCWCDPAAAWRTCGVDRGVFFAPLGPAPMTPAHNSSIATPKHEKAPA